MDSIVRTVIAKFEERSKFGKAKYGTDLDRTDLSVMEWIQHAQEEHMDAILYLEKLKQTLGGPPESPPPPPPPPPKAPSYVHCQHPLGLECVCGAQFE